MKHRIPHESASLLLEYDVPEGYIHAIWARDQTPTTTTAGCERILEYLGHRHCHRRLDNHKAIHGHWANLADWVTLSRYPRAQRAGLKNQAVVYSMD